MKFALPGVSEARIVSVRLLATTRGDYWRPARDGSVLLVLSCRHRQHAVEQRHTSLVVRPANGPPDDLQANGSAHRQRPTVRISRQIDSADRRRSDAASANA
jgi:hypothetical protein